MGITKIHPRAPQSTPGVPRLYEAFFSFEVTTIMCFYCYIVVFLNENNVDFCDPKCTKGHVMDPTMPLEASYSLGTPGVPWGATFFNFEITTIMCFYCYMVVF